MSTSETDVVRGIRPEYQYGFANSDEAENYFFRLGRGLSHELVEAIAGSTSKSPTGCGASGTRA